MQSEVNVFPLIIGTTLRPSPLYAICADLSFQISSRFNLLGDTGEDSGEAATEDESVGGGGVKGGRADPVDTGAGGGGGKDAP